MEILIDTNVLVYRFDPRFPEKQRIATAILRRGIVMDNIRIPHQAVLEFISATTRSVQGEPPLLGELDAAREAEEFLHQFRVLFPNVEIVRLALRGWAAYRLPWFDAHLWAYAEYYGLREICSEDFQHGRLYGSVTARNPFL